MSRVGDPGGGGLVCGGDLIALIAVLASGPVQSAADAVRALILAEGKE
jgi:hypothetical protein